MVRFFNFFLVMQDVLGAIMGLSASQRCSIAGTSAARTVSYQALAALSAAVTLGVDVFIFRTKTGAGFVSATLVAIVSGLILFFIERDALAKLRADRATKGVNIIRFVTLAIILPSAVLLTTVDFENEITAFETRELSQKEHELRSQPRFKARLEHGEKALAESERAAERLSEIQREISKEEIAIGNLTLDQKRACQGGEFDGKYYGKPGFGCQWRAEDAANNKKRHEASLSALNKEKNELENVAQKRLQAEQNINEINREIRGEIENGSLGISSKVTSLFNLIQGDFIARFVFFFWVTLLSLPEIMAYRAYRINQNDHNIFLELAQLEHRIVISKIYQEALEFKETIAAKGRVLPVKITPLKLTSINVQKPQASKQENVL